MNDVLLRLRWRIEYLLVWPLLRLVQILPESLAQRLCKTVGRCLYWVLANDRRWCLLNLRLVYRDRLTPTERRRLAQQIFEHHGLTFCEILRMTPAWLSEKVIFDDTALRRLDKYQGKVLAVSGHLGNFEIFGGALAERHTPTYMVSRPLDNPHLEAMLQRRRRQYNLSTVERSSMSFREAIRGLRAGRMLGVAIDQNTTQNPIFVNYFGIPAATARGAVSIAMKENVPVVVIAAIRQPDGKHLFHVDPPIEMIRTGIEEHDVRVNMQRLMDRWEEFVRQHPEQYHWQHGRFRTRPDGSSWRSTDRYEDLLASLQSTNITTPQQQAA